MSGARAGSKRSAEEILGTGLSNNLRDALKNVALKKEAIMMSEQLAERLELEKAHKVDKMEFAFEYELEAESEVFSEGVKHLENKTPAELYKLLGLERHSIPYFKDKGAVEQDVSSKSGGLETIATTTQTEGGSLPWHQLVVVVRAMERGMRSEPVLLIDTIDLGKTVPVIATFAMLAYYREYYREKRRYPGLWGESNQCNLFVYKCG